MESVISSNLKAVGYDPLHSLLRIEFNNGSIYDYFGVPQSIYQGLKNA
ncbi:MAG: KTSC domain-containing protein, partial [archaeon]|nr:KTSC domain-containing protein [archaeon]